MTGKDEEDIFPVILKGSVTLLVLMSIGAFFLFSTKAAAGVMAGGAVAILNFIWIRRALEQMLGVMPENPARYSAVRFIIRISATGFVLFFVLRSELVTIPGLFSGLSIIVINIIAISIIRTARSGG